jgi:hypothetical protein
MLATFFGGRWLPIGSRPGARAAVIVCAVLVDWLVRSVGLAVGADYVVVDQGQRAQVGYGTVALVAVVISLVGWVVLAVLERVTRHARVIWTTGALVLLALSFLPVAGSQGSAATKAFLALINIATAVVVVPVMRRTTLRREQRLAPDVSSSGVGA